MRASLPLSPLFRPLSPTLPLPRPLTPSLVTTGGAFFAHLTLPLRIEQGDDSALLCAVALPDLTPLHLTPHGASGLLAGTTPLTLHGPCHPRLLHPPVVFIWPADHQCPQLAEVVYKGYGSSTPSALATEMAVRPPPLSVLQSFAGQARCGPSSLTLHRRRQLIAVRLPLSPVT